MKSSRSPLAMGTILLVLVFAVLGQARLAQAFGVTPSVSSGPTPGAVVSGATTVAGLTATVDTSGVNQEALNNGASWQWIVSSSAYSTDGSSWGGAPSGSSINVGLSSPYTQNTALSCYGTPGYWKVTCYLICSYSDNMGNTWVTAPSLDVVFTVVSPIIVETKWAADQNAVYGSAVTHIAAGAKTSVAHRANVHIQLDPAMIGHTLKISLIGGAGLSATASWWDVDQNARPAVMRLNDSQGNPLVTPIPPSSYGQSFDLGVTTVANGSMTVAITSQTGLVFEGWIQSSNIAETVQIKAEATDIANSAVTASVASVVGTYKSDLSTHASASGTPQTITFDIGFCGVPTGAHKLKLFVASVRFNDGTSKSADKGDGTLESLAPYVQLMGTSSPVTNAIVTATGDVRDLDTPGVQPITVTIINPNVSDFQIGIADMSIMVPNN